MISLILTQNNHFYQNEQDPEVEEPRTKKEVRVNEHSQELGLGCVQISVTAATPMVEDADKSFLNDIIKEQSDDNEQLHLDEQLEKDVAEAVDEILQEACIQTNNQKKEIKESTEANNTEPVKPLVLRKSAGPKPDHGPTKCGPPSVPPPPPPIAAAIPDDDKNQFEAHFEANFEDAFCEAVPELPKQLGGRASIPDDLAPDQLERLKNLKESNA